MENVIPLDLLDIVHSFDLSRLFLTVIIVFIGKLADESVLRGRRGKIALKQRELYYQKLTSKSLKMESDKLDDELKIVQNIDALEKEKQDYLNSTDSDWSGDDDGPDTRRMSTSEEEQDERTSSDKVSKELDDYETKARELESINEGIGNLAQDMNEVTVEDVEDSRDICDASQELNARIQQLELQNEELKAQLAQHTSQLLVPKRESDLDPSILQFIEQHQDELTLDFLEKAYQTLVELKASDQSKDFSEYMNDLKSIHMNYAAKLTELNVAKKEVEIKLRVVKQRYQEEMTSFNETKLEQVFKTSVANERLTALKEKNTILSEIIADLKSELEAKRSEAALWKDKCKEAEKQFGVYWQSWKDTQMKLAQLEAEQRTNPDRSGMINLSSASSFAEHQVPPPPAIDAPSREEIFRAQPGSNLFSTGGSNIPPPPPLVDLPLADSTGSGGLKFR